MNGEVHQHPGTPRNRSHTGGRNGNGHDVHARVSAIEARLDYLATKEDIQRVEKLISDREASMQRLLIGMQRWLVGILVALGLGFMTTVGTLALVLLRLFGN